MSVCRDREYELCFTEMPLYSVLSEWVMKNVCVPVDTMTWLVHIALFFLTWYVVKFTIRLVLSVLWPLIIICTGLVLFRLLQDPNRDQTLNYLFFRLGDIYSLMVKASSKIPHVLQQLYSTDSSPTTLPTW